MRRPVENAGEAAGATGQRPARQRVHTGDAGHHRRFKIERRLVLARQGLQVQAVGGHQRLVRGDDGNTEPQRARDQVARRFYAAEDFDDDVAVGEGEIVGVGVEGNVGTDAGFARVTRERADTLDEDARIAEAATGAGGQSRHRLPHPAEPQQPDTHHLHGNIDCRP